MADCGQHALRSAADEWLAGDILIAAGRHSSPFAHPRAPKAGEFESF
jgi:hypothetical protein